MIFVLTYMLPQHYVVAIATESMGNDIIPSYTKTENPHLLVTPVLPLPQDASVWKMMMIDHEAVETLSAERSSPLLLIVQLAGDHPSPILDVSHDLHLPGEDEKKHRMPDHRTI
mmetsp:Transcript_632/g.1001  ORF Transcript_632/g.1001 Transcript_632/m.1001 type:complete len:114 (+) Transcript_632:1511-1852(+)